MNQYLKLAIHFWISKLLLIAPPLINQLLALVGMKLTVNENAADTITSLLVMGIGLAYSWWTHRQTLAAPAKPPTVISSVPIRAPLVALLLLPAIGALTGCGTTGGSSTSTTTTGTTTSTTSATIEAALPLVRTGAAVATGAVLDFAVKQTGTRTRLANEMYSAANAVYSLSGGTFPSPTQFQSSILAFGGSQSDANYAQFSTAIAGLYAAYYPKLITGDTKTATDLLNAIAGGIEDATQSYVTVPATTPSS